MGTPGGHPLAVGLAPPVDRIVPSAARLPCSRPRRLSVHRPHPPSQLPPGLELPQAAQRPEKEMYKLCVPRGLAGAVRPGCYRLSPLPACLSTLVGHTITPVHGALTPALPSLEPPLRSTFHHRTSFPTVHKGPLCSLDLQHRLHRASGHPFPPTAPRFPFPLGTPAGQETWAGGVLISAPGHWPVRTGSRGKEHGGGGSGWLPRAFFLGVPPPTPPTLQPHPSS